MIAAVADTHTALWYLYDDTCLSMAAGDFIDQAAMAGSQIVVSAISLAEIVYLIEKNRLPTPDAALMNIRGGHNPHLAAGRQFSVAREAYSAVFLPSCPVLRSHAERIPLNA